KSVTHITNGESVVWTCDCGDLFTDLSATTPYTGTSITAVYLKADNQTKSGTVNAGDTVHTINITGVFPFQPNYDFNWKLDKRGVISNTKRSGKRNGRILGDGELVKDKHLVFRRRRISEYNEFQDFFEWHYPHKTFKYGDLHLDETNLF